MKKEEGSKGRSKKEEGRSYRPASDLLFLTSSFLLLPFLPSSFSSMNWPFFLAEHPPSMAGPGGLAFGQDGQGDLLGAFGANVQPDGIVQTMGRQRRGGNTFFLTQLPRHFLCAFSWTHQAQVAQVEGKQLFKPCPVDQVIVRHDHGGSS